MVGAGPLVFRIVVRPVVEVDIVGQGVRLNVPEVDGVEVPPADLDRPLLAHDGDAPLVILVVNAVRVGESPHHTGFELHHRDAAVLDLDAVALRLPDGVHPLDVAEHVNEQVDEVAALGVEGAPFMLLSAQPAGPVVVALGPVPEDRAMDPVDLAQRLVL